MLLSKLLREKSVKELVSIKEELQKRLYVVKLQTSISQNQYTHKISALKKDIARVLTVLTEKKVKADEIYQITLQVRDADFKKAVSAEQDFDQKLTDKKVAEAKNDDAKKESKPIKTAPTKKESKPIKTAPTKINVKKSETSEKIKETTVKKSAIKREKKNNESK